jgi:MFS family permease
MFVLAYAFLTTYQAYYLLEKLGSAEDDVPHQLFLATLAMSSVVVVASLVGGWLSDRTGRRKVFVCAASFVFGLAMFVIAISSSFNGFVVGMAIGGFGFGLRAGITPRRRGSRSARNCRISWTPRPSTGWMPSRAVSP